MKVVGTRTSRNMGVLPKKSASPIGRKVCSFFLRTRSGGTTLKRVRTGSKRNLTRKEPVLKTNLMTVRLYIHILSKRYILLN